MKMTRICCFVGALAFMASPAIADVFLGEARHTRLPSHSSGNGGEFTFWTSDAMGTPGLSNMAYSPLTRDQGGFNDSFQTFCVEKGENTDNPMAATLSTTWASGTDSPQWSSGNFSPQSHAVEGNKPTLGGDDLNPQTAYLYTQFATGLLGSGATAYDYDPNGGRSVDAGLLQDLIWFLEEETTTLATDAKTTAWLNEANAAVADASIWGETIGSVRILNMLKSDGTFGQDQLYFIPAPAALLLGVIGIGVIGIARRRGQRVR